MTDSRRKEQLRIQAVGAAISRRDWHAVEQAYNAIRDEFDRRATPSSPVSSPSPAGGVREALEAADRLEALAFSKQMSQRPLDYEQVETIFKAVSTIRAALSSPATGEVVEALRLVRPVIAGLIEAEYNVETWGLKGRLAVIDAVLSESRVCEVCSGDCSAANPPPSYCPTRDAALNPAPGHGEGGL